MRRPLDSVSAEEEALEMARSTTRESTPKLPTAEPDLGLLWRTFFDATSDDVAVYDFDDRVVSHNGTVPWLDHGLAPSELKGTCIYDFAPPDQREKVARAFTLARDTKTSTSLEIEAGISSPAGPRYFEVRVAPAVKGGDVAALVTIARDVTAERAAERAKKTLAAMMEPADDAFVTISLEGIVEEISAGFSRLFGYSVDEMRGRSIMRLVPQGHSEEVRAHLALVARGERVERCDVKRAKKDGTVVDVEVELTPIGASGGVTGAICRFREKKLSPELERALELADRMRAVGALAAGVTHEINNPLAYVLSNLELMSDIANTWHAPVTKVEVERLRESIAHARSGAERIRTVAADFKTFSRHDGSERPVDLRRVINLALHLARHQILRRARLVSEIGDLPSVMGNETRLGQVFLNLLVNAAQAIPEGNTERHEVRISAKADGSSVAVTISDTGSGLGDDVRKRIFDPFFTTKLAGVGTGLGLTVSRSIVSSLGGTIEAEPCKERGTAFRVTLPILATVVRPSPKPPTLAPRGNVLIIDDHVLISSSVGMVLSSEHDVKTSTSARDALARIHRGESYDVIVCDLMMPEMSGMELHAELVRTAPGLARRMIFMTGGAFTAAAREFVATISNPSVDKPLHFDTLRKLIRDVIADESIPKK